MSGFDWSHIQSAETLETARAYRFPVELRPVILGHLGMAPGMDVLEVCCGPGTLAPYLAAGLSPGSVTGLDLDSRFIERAQAKADAAGLTGVHYIVGDAYALPFPDHSFDAVTSYAGIGVLGDPVQAVREMIRVCRKGGTVSVTEPISAASASGSLELTAAPDLYPGAQEYSALSQRLKRLYQEVLLPREQIGSSQWPVHSFFALAGSLGLERVRINAWGYCHAPDDARVAEGVRQSERQSEFDAEQSWLKSLLCSSEGELLAGKGFTHTDVQRLIALSETRQQWLLTRPAYEWTAGLSMAVAGTKPCDPVKPDAPFVRPIG